MKKRLILLGALLALALLVAAPAVMAQTADLSQSNAGGVISANDADQTADQRQYAPGGDAQYNVRGDVDEENDTLNVRLFNNNNDDDDFDVFIFDGGDDDIDTDVDQEGGDGGTQEIDQRQTQNATATGAAFGATQAVR